MSLTEFIQQQPVLTQANEILFYGGSFNPWHQGHEACIKLAPKDKPLVVLPDNNPHKEINPNKQLDLDGLEKKLQEINPNTYLFREYYLDDKPNPTIDWVQELKTNFPKLSTSLLMGFDSFIKLDTWKENQTLLTGLKALYIASRLDQDEIKKSKTQIYQEMAPKLEIQFLGHHEFEHLSSTKIRRSLT